jgi:hypothetical protein
MKPVDLPVLQIAFSTYRRERPSGFCLLRHLSLFRYELFFWRPTKTNSEPDGLHGPRRREWFARGGTGRGRD